MNTAFTTIRTEMINVKEGLLSKIGLYAETLNWRKVRVTYRLKLTKIIQKHKLDDIFVSNKLINSYMKFDAYFDFEGVPSDEVIILVNNIRLGQHKIKKTNK